jgi:hypothetical protein
VLTSAIVSISGFVDTIIVSLTPARYLRQSAQPRLGGPRRRLTLRLHEAGLIKSSPQKLIAEHTDWRFLNELKRELKV